jgi:hypothetical protein
MKLSMFRKISVVVAGLALTLAACGSDDAKSGTDTVAPLDTSAQDTGLDTLPTDTTPDTMPTDTTPDTLPDTAQDTALDTTPDTLPDTLPDTAQDTPQDTSLAEQGMSNWGFEEAGQDDPPADFLKGTGAFTANRVTTVFHTGLASCKLTWTSSNNQDFEQEYTMPVSEGSTVTLKAWALDNDNLGNGRLALYFYDAGGAKVRTEYGTLQDFTDDNAEWQEMTLAETVAAGEASVRGFIRLYDENWPEPAAGTEAPVLYLDDWSLTETLPE